MWDEHKSLFRRRLEEKGFASTRAHDLDKAIKQLHSAICQIDSTAGQRQALRTMMNTSVRDLIDEFAEVEELRRAHEIEST